MSLINAGWITLLSTKQGYRDCRFYQVSTDEVYGSLGKEGLFTEQTPYAPNSPYSASKASGDMIARSYHHTYGLNVVISHCSNNYGIRQHSEKLIPTIIRKALKNEPIPIYGNGSNVRDWLSVIDHCRGIDLVFHQANAGEHYNMGGECEKSNIDLAYDICSMLDNLVPNAKGYKHLISYVKDRAGHDQRYGVDIQKIKKELEWSPQEEFEKNIEDTIQWYVQKNNF